MKRHQSNRKGHPIELRIHHWVIFLVIILITWSIPTTAMLLINVQETNFTIDSIGEVNNNIKIVHSFPFNITFNPTTISQLNDETTNITMSIDYSEIRNGTYNGKIFVISDETVKYFDHVIVIPISSNFSIDVTNLEIITNTSEETSREIKLENEGNVNLHVKTYVHVNLTDLIYIPENIFLPYNDYNTVLLQTIPDKSIPSGTYTGNIIFNNSYGFEQIMNVVVDIEDTTKPTISNISIVENEVMRPISLQALVTDNINIAYVNATLHRFDNIKKLELSKTEDNDFWIGSIVLDEAGEWKVLIYAGDEKGNQVSKEKTINISESTMIIYEPNINFATQKYGTYRKHLMFVSDPMDLTLNLTSFSFNFRNITQINNMSYIFSLITPSSRYDLSESVNSVVLPDFKGSLELEIGSEYPADFSGLIRFDTPAFINITDITFSGAFKRFMSCPEYQTTIYGNLFSCKPVEFDTYESSYCECIQRLPIDTNLTEISAVLTNPLRLKEEIDIFKKDAEGYRSDRNMAIFQRNLIGSLALLFIIFLILHSKYSGKLNFKWH